MSNESSKLWWKVARHVDEAKLAAANAMVSDGEDPTRALALQVKLAETQALLLEIFRDNGLVPKAANGTHVTAVAASDEITAEAVAPVVVENVDLTREDAKIEISPEAVVVENVDLTPEGAKVEAAATVVVDDAPREVEKVGL